MRELFSRWFEHLETRVRDGEIKLTTLQDYKSHHKVWLHTLDAVLVSALQKQHVERLVAEMRPQLSAKTIANCLGTLTGAIQFARDQEIIFANPLDGFKAPRQRKVEMWIPTAEQMQRLMRSLDSNTSIGLRNALMIRIAAVTGMRIGEIRALSWDCVDFERGLVRVNKDADRNQIIGEPKTSAAFRTIGIDAGIVSQMRRWKIDCPAMGAVSVSPHLDGSVAKPMRAAGLCFPTQSGRLLDYQDCRENVLQPALERAGLSDVWVRAWHTFRHWAASRMIEIGKSPKYIQTKLGHEDIKTTFNRYGHQFDREADAETAEAMGQF